MTFNPNRTKVQLKLAINRLKLLQQKKNQFNQGARKEIATLLEKGKEESARVRVEHIIREDFNIEALEILELYSELLLARFGLLETMKHCDQAIAEAVNTIIYAAPRCEVKELNMVRDQLIMKFGKEFALAAMENQNDIVNSRIVHKLKVQTPDPVLVNQYLRTIAKAYNVQWDGDQSDLLIDSIPPSQDMASAGFGFLPPTSPGQSPVPQPYPQQQFPQQGFPQQGFPQQDFTQPPNAGVRPPPPQQYPQSHPQVPSPIFPDGAGGRGFDFPTPPGGQKAPFAGDVQPRPSATSDGIPGGTGSDIPDFDELTKRFEALKRKS
ncbi:Vacuolar protein sorting-associated protein ist1 [Rhizophlyctis rosea]|uniref:Vacuolar protein sorting-associated protein ist1 n=1 Tax=Rhizophlyctis rosea TaxID=64517 RepID=A0AAD5X0U5_9FUNG|nr:Vacuolar protein sorting-associated protein ist1 [Rhizophlyctis rosea]